MTKNYPNLCKADGMEVLCAPGEWKLYWKQRVVDDPDFDVLHLMCCNGGRGHATTWVWRVALNALTFSVTTTVAEGSYHERLVDH